jgi:RHS repeat-associated protein
MLKTIYPESGDLNDVIYTYGASGDGKNGAGRIVKIKQGDNFKTDNFKYDILGNVIYEKKKINVPLAGDREFISEFGYDSWGRILEMTYPDGEKVAYNYNTSGDLSRIDGYLPNAGPTYIILDYLQYAGFGNIIKQAYGNGALTEFTYDANRRMKGVELNSNSHQLLDKTYSYDDLGNIADVINAASALSLNGNTIGGEYEISGINYDGLNQVSSLSLRFGPTSAPVHNISMDMTYSAGGRLLFKNLDDQAGGTSDYSLNYLYDVSSGKDHQLKTVQNAAGNDFSFDYNNVGSIIQKTEIDGAAPGTDLVEDFCWNEHQTLRGVKRGTEDHADLAHYVYDHSGERVLKTIITGSILNTNSQGQSAFSMESPTVYVNPYYIASHYLETELASKHYYMGGQRIASSLISLPFNTGSQTDPGMGGEGEEGEGPVFGEGNLSTSEDAVIQDLSATFNCLFGRTIELDYEGMLKLSSIGEPILFDDCEGGESSEASEIDPTCACEQSTYWAQIGGVACNTMPIMYWYHPDYLGSVEFVTDMAGDPYQFFHNTIWGENLQNHMAFNFKSFSSRFRFNEGRALRNRPVAYFSEGARLPRWQWDEEPTLGSSRAPLKEEWGEQTGNFYYGARYYDPKISVWLSVDPLADEFQGWSPYNFTMNNPLNLVDPDGREVVIHGDSKKEAFKQLKKVLKYEGVELLKEKTEKGYVLSYKTKSAGTKFSKGVSELLAAMRDSRVTIEIQAESTAFISSTQVSNGVSFMGSTYTNKDFSVKTKQYVVPEMLKELEIALGLEVGFSMMHEATEAAVASYMAIDGCQVFTKNGEGYNKADAAAYPQPTDQVKTFFMQGSTVLPTNIGADRIIWTTERPNAFGVKEPYDFWIEYIPIP